MLDAVIIGSGPAGLSAALNLKKYNKEFVWFGSRNMSEKVKRAELITNYPGIPDATGEQLLEAFRHHMEVAGIEITEKTVTTVMKGTDVFMSLADNEIYESKTVILTMGVMNAKQLENEAELLGRGVSYCATCDGGLYRNRKIAVLCNDAKYEHEVKYLSDLASEVVYFPQYRDPQVAADNITVSGDFPIRVNGEKRVESLTLRSGAEVQADGIFCLRNAIAPSALMPGLPVEDGHIKVNRAMETGIAGCFAAGDCTGRPYQYTKAVGEGNVAAHSCIRYLDQK